MKTITFNGKKVSYPLILDDIQYSPIYNQQEIIKHKLELTKHAETFAK